MTSVIISLEIIDFLPNTFNFSDFGFIFKCENLENEITFLEHNQIIHKFQLKKRDLKYNIKVTKNDSLIGISEFVIPYNNFLVKKMDNFEKVCSITMTDSSKRLLGLKNNMQIDVHCVLQYIINSNNQNSLKQSHSLPKNEMKKKLNMSPKVSSENILKNNHSSSNKKKEHSQKIQNINKNGTGNMKYKSSNQIKNYNKNNFKEKNILEKKIFSNTPDTKKSKNEKNINNESFINSLIEKPSNESEIEKKFKFLSVDNFQNNNNMNIDNIKQNIFNLIDNIINLEKNFKNILNEKLKLRNNYKKYLTRYYNNYKNIKKKEKKLDKILNSNDFKNNQTIKINREENNNINKIIKSYNIHFDLYKFLLKYDNQNNINNDDENLNIILKSFNNVITRYGSIEKVLANNINNNNNLINNEILSKYNLLLNINNNNFNNNNLINEKIEEENENEISQENYENNNIYFENVIVSKPDNNDIKLEKFLKNFYSKRNFNKKPFKKTSKNNYEYDNQKLMLKFEGDNIRVRYKGGYILLDKFIEANSDSMEENKSKNKKKANSSANKKKNFINNYKK